MKYLVLKEKSHQPRILHPVKSSSKSEEKETLLRQTKMREAIASRPALQEMPQEILQEAGKVHRL